MKLSELFQGKKVFIPFVVLGDPDRETSLEVVKALVDSGADALELGFPFSDPLLDGAVIQAAHKRAMMPVDDCFALLHSIRQLTDAPVGVMVSFNLVFRRGIRKFYQDCKAAGVDSVLVPDIPLEEADELLGIADELGLCQIPLISPDTPDERIAQISSRFSGYAYLVSVLGTTGSQSSAAAELIRKVKKNSKLPVCIGFGISTPEQASFAVKCGADGVVLGTPLCRIIGGNLQDKKAMLRELAGFAREMGSAIGGAGNE